jgi:hypothetical protein
MICTGVGVEQLHTYAHVQLSCQQADCTPPAAANTSRFMQPQPTNMSVQPAPHCIHLAGFVLCVHLVRCQLVRLLLTEMLPAATEDPHRWDL